MVIPSNIEILEVKSWATIPHRIQGFVIIPTSQKRTSWLVGRALRSVYFQRGVDPSEWMVLIVDDNEDKHEIEHIYEKIYFLRLDLGLNYRFWPTLIIRNFRKRGRSGTGAWNSGLLLAREISPKAVVSFLDDDDAYAPTHLRDCLNASSESKVVAAFQQVVWLMPSGHTWMPMRLQKEKMTQNHFLVGNPGVQGSNMFFKLTNILEVGGFDENFYSTTDREIMIRFLDKYDKRQIQVLSSPGVFYYHHNHLRVTTSSIYKHTGLSLFYKKFYSMFSEKFYFISLLRANRLFNYIPNL